MLSFFSVPKAFVGPIAVIQHNAIASWVRSVVGCEIVLLGDEKGVAEAAALHGIKQVRTIAFNELGTPRLADVFARMDALAEFDLLAFVNADIVLLSDFLSAVRAVRNSRDRFLLVSSRYNCRIDQPLAFATGWDADLRTRVRAENRMYPAAGSDLFIFPRGLFRAMPDFGLGRGYWDNWLLYEARRLGVSVIDATEVLTAVHQDHGYKHIPAISADADEYAIYASDEGRRNLALAGGHGRLYTLFDATEVLSTNGQLRPTLVPPLTYRRIKASVRRMVGPTIAAKIRRLLRYLP